jgi:hypothetical protein
LLLPALALAGAPLTSGAVAKIALKGSLALLPPAWIGVLDWLLPLTAAGTTLLMARFLFLAWPQADESASHLAPGLWLPWIILLVGVAIAVWLMPWNDSRDLAWQSASPIYFWTSLWPVLAGTGLGWMAWSWTRWSGGGMRFRIPAGDVLVAVTWLLDRIRGAGNTKARCWLASRLPGSKNPKWNSLWQRLRIPLLLTRMENGLALWPVVGLSLLTVAALLILVALVARH